ncbi:hypothetical protein FQN55_008555 [Onygenales sp. PD_40]|nr:hypothetical protein FQN55_008555 [Onygenales sp. PD_40]KAK2806243.1 hypothetical protein FQN51_007284 [Onygenales sp. PD_10]
MASVLAYYFTYFEGIEDEEDPGGGEAASDDVGDADDHNEENGDALRDIIQQYRALQDTPGGGEATYDGWDNDDIDLRALYRKNGWPDNFNGDTFEAVFEREPRAMCG